MPSFHSNIPALLFMAGIFFINFLSRIILAPLLPAIETDLHIGHGEAGAFFLLISLGYLDEPVGWEIPPLLDLAGRPYDPEEIDPLAGTEAEEGPHVVVGKKAAAGANGPDLTFPAGDDFQAGAESVAVALCSPEQHGEALPCGISQRPCRSW